MLPLAHAGRWLTDGAGRVVVMHGINMVYKLPPYAPDASGFGDDDAAFLQSIGFDVVRVGVIWKAVEPQPGVYDDAYLGRIAATVRTLARHGIVSLLDFHQDNYNERYHGEGAPDWAVQDDGLPNPNLDATFGFGANYQGDPALQRALDHFWADSPGPGGVGLQDRFAAAWRHVAARFAGDPAVLGYEIFNEPFPGTGWERCANPAGCPDYDATLGRFYARVLPAIRMADHRGLVFYEPNVIFNNGADTNLPKLADASLGFAFHDYCLTEPSTGSDAGCDTFDDLVFANAQRRAQSTGDAVIETEFGATNDVGYLDAMVQRADRYMTPWIEWAYCACGDPTTSGPGDKEAIVRDPTKPPAGSNLVLPTLGALVEPYPQLVAGTPRSWSFDRASRTFTLRYVIDRPGGGAAFGPGSVTEIATPAFVYTGGYRARVAGGVAVSAAGEGLLRIASCPGAGAVSVTVTPAGPGGGSCRLRLAISVAPRHPRAGRPTRLRFTVRAALGAFSAPVAGARISFDGRHARTDRRGRAVIRVALRRGRRYRATATASGDQPGTVTVAAS